MGQGGKSGRQYAIYRGSRVSSHNPKQRWRRRAHPRARMAGGTHRRSLSCGYVAAILDDESLPWSSLRVDWTLLWVRGVGEERSSIGSLLIVKDRTDGLSSHDPSKSHTNLPVLSYHCFGSPYL